MNFPKKLTGGTVIYKSLAQDPDPREVVSYRIWHHKRYVEATVLNQQCQRFVGAQVDHGRDLEHA